MRRALLLLSAAAITISPALAQPYYAQPYPQPYPQGYPQQGYPQQGPPQGRYLNQRDVAEAQREHAEIVRDLGGEEGGQRAAYVNSVGQRVAAFSGVAVARSTGLRTRRRCTRPSALSPSATEDGAGPPSTSAR